MAALAPNPQFLDGITPTIDLLGKKWPVPLLTPRQNRIVVPAILRLMPMLAGVAGMGAQAQDGVVAFPRGRIPSPVDFTEAQYDDLLKVVFWGLKRAHPDLDWELFQDLPITTRDLFYAFTTISRQTGLLQPAGEVKDPATPFETPTETSPTGTASSPESATSPDGDGNRLKTS